MDVDFLRYKFEDGYSGVATRTKLKIGVRHLQLLYMFTLSTVLGVTRGANVVAVMSMSDGVGDGYDDSYIDVRISNWSKSIQGAIVASFFWGYTFTILPAELFTKKCNGKVVCTTVLVINGLLCLFLPTIAKEGGWMAVCNTQFLMGMTQATVSPTNQMMIKKWLPPYEKKMCSGVVYSGVLIGLMISYPAAAKLASCSFLGWELVYYSLAMLMLPAAIMWGTLTAGKPEDHPAMGDKEKEFISEELQYYKEKSIRIPWREVIRTPTFWAVTSAHVASKVVFVLFLVVVPGYFKYVMKEPLSQYGWLSSLPFLSMWITHLAVSPTIEWLHSTGFISYGMHVTTFRKIVNYIGTIGNVLGLIALSYFGTESETSALVLLCAVMALSAFQYSGFLEVHRDMSQNFCGSLLTLSSVPSSAVSALVPFVSGIILNSDVTDPRGWRVVFLTTASICLACQLVFLVLGSADRQFWDHQESFKCSYGDDVNHVELEDLQDRSAKGKPNEEELY